MAIYYLNNSAHGKTVNGININTKAHFDYISREGKYENRQNEDLVYLKSGNLPVWAEGKAGEFWNAAEEARNENGRAYREIKLGLQEELSLEENIELVDEFCKKVGVSENHAYTYAIHDKTASFDKNHRNIHVHIMMSEKTIEKDRPLNQYDYFKKYSETKDGKPIGGYRSDRYFSNKQSTLDMRKIWADIVNEKFKEKGIDIQISEKTLNEQYTALMNDGKKIEAEFYNRTPAPHLGKKYRNPYKKEEINELVRTFTLGAENAGWSKENNEKIVANEEKENEQIIEKLHISDRDKLIVFAADVVMREIARELQTERKKALEQAKEIQKENNNKEENKIENEPYVITVSDIEIIMNVRAEEARQEKMVLLGLAKEVQKELKSDQEISDLALNKTCPGYLFAKQHIDKLQQRKFETEKLFATGKCDYDTKYHAYEDWRRAKLIIEESEQYRKYNILENKRLQEPWLKEREELQAKIKDLQNKAKEKQNEYDFYHARILAMQERFKGDEVLYAEDLTKSVSWEDRLNGKKELKDFLLIHPPKGLGKQEETYIVIDNVSDIRKRSSGDQTKTVRAVKIGDRTVIGKAPVYTFDLKFQDGISIDGMRPTREAVMTTVPVKTEETVPLYKPHNYIPEKLLQKEKMNNLSRIRMRLPSPARQNVINGTCRTLLNTNKNTAADGHLIKLHKEEKHKKPDAVEVAEQEMEQFAKGLRFRKGMNNGFSR